MVSHTAAGVGHLVVLAVVNITGGQQHSVYVGVICLFLTFLGNGTHSAFAKLAGEFVPVLVFLNYLSLGMLLGCTVLVAAMGEPFVLSWPGFLGGFLLFGSISCYVNSIKRIGIVWCDMMTLRRPRYIDKVYFREPSQSFVGAAIGLTVLLCGILGISVMLFHRLQQLGGETQARPRVPGMALAACAGTFGGTCFAVSKLHPEEEQGVSFAWAQALGVCMWLAVPTTLALLSDMLAAKSKGHDEAIILGRTDARRLAPLGLAQGGILALTNITTIVAAVSPVGIGVTQPVREAGHSLAVLIGVFAFREYGVPDWRFVSQLSALTVANVVGIIVLTISGTAPG